MTDSLMKTIDPWGDMDFELCIPWMNAILDSLSPHVCLPSEDSALPRAEELPVILVMRLWGLMTQGMDTLSDQ